MSWGGRSVGFFVQYFSEGLYTIWMGILAHNTGKMFLIDMNIEAKWCFILVYISYFPCLKEAVLVKGQCCWWYNSFYINSFFCHSCLLGLHLFTHPIDAVMPVEIYSINLTFKFALQIHIEDNPSELNNNEHFCPEISLALAVGKVGKIKFLSEFLT